MMADVGAQIRQARLARDLTLTDLARQVFVTKSYIGDFERGDRTPPEDLMRRICAVLDLDPELLLAAAGRLSVATRAYLRTHPTAGVLLHHMVAARLDEDTLQPLLALVEDLTVNQGDTPR